jgi:hypothetical protein
MGRPPTGQTPPKERIAKYRDKLVQSGGRRIIVDLPSEGAKALEAVQARDGSSITGAVSEALIKFAKTRKKTP